MGFAHPRYVPYPYVIEDAPDRRSSVVCLEYRRSKRRCATVRETRDGKVADKSTQTVISALIKQSKRFPSELYKSLTWDRGKEPTDHRRFSLATDIDVYLCNPRRHTTRS